MDVGVGVGLAVLGVIVAEMLEALRLYTIANGWPRGVTVGRYLMVSAVRLALAAVVALSLTTMGMLCDKTLAFLAGLSTLKVMEILFGYSPRA